MSAPALLDPIETGPLLAAADAAADSAPDAVALVPRPAALRLPIRVPVVADCGTVPFRAEVIGSTPGVLLLESHDKAAAQPLGTPIRVKLEWDRQVLNGRVAAHGADGRFLVSIGERGIRRSRRYPVDLPGSLSSAALAAPGAVRVKDLSTGGARIEGIDLPVGSDVSLSFTPPNRAEPLTVLGFVVRGVPGAAVPSVGVAFRLVQTSMDVLGGASLGAAKVSCPSAAPGRAASAR